MKLTRIFPPLPCELDDPSPEEQAADLEAQRMIARASGRLLPDSSLHPLRFFSLESLREVFTMGGRFTLIRYAENGVMRMGAAGYALIIAAAGMFALVLMLFRAILNGEY